MDFLYFLEGIRIPVLNEIMLFVTQLGEETAFLVIAMIIFWCVDKHTGYYILSVGFMGTLSNQFLKLVFRVPRPWVIDSIPVRKSGSGSPLFQLLFWCLFQECI